MNFFDNDFDFKNKYNELINRVAKYDVFDFISKISSLNLIPNNQNKNNVLAEFIDVILSKDISFYTSNAIISYSEFKSIVVEFFTINQGYDVDPFEMPFIENISFYGNNWVFSGVSYYSAYQLQSLLDSIFLYKNNFNQAFKTEVSYISKFVLDLSTSIVNELGYSFETLGHYEVKDIEIPNVKTMKQFAKNVIVSMDSIYKLIGCYDFDISIFSTFDSNKTCTNDNDFRFFRKPFIKKPNNNEFIVLDPTILPVFLIYRIIEIADKYNIRNEVIDTYNNIVFRDCLSQLSELGHHKIQYDKSIVKTINCSNYKEEILSLSNDGILFIRFYCDDGRDYDNKIVDAYKVDTVKQKNRLRELLTNFKIVKNERVYEIIVLSTFFRSVNCNTFDIKSNIIECFPYDLKCIAANEAKTNNFIFKYIEARKKLSNWSYFSQDIDYIALFTSNNNSFYVSDDMDYRKINLQIGFGDTVEYRNKAALSQKIHLKEFPNTDMLRKVRLIDDKRNIFASVIPSQPTSVEYVIETKKYSIWIISDVIDSVDKMDLNFSMIDLISYWLAECKFYLDTHDLISDNIIVSIKLAKNITEYYNTENCSNDELEKLLQIETTGSTITINLTPACFLKFSCDTNESEKAFIELIIEQLTSTPVDYKLINTCFENPLKKKMFSLDYTNFPYYEPMLDDKLSDSNSFIDSISDDVGDYFLKEQKLPYGVIDGEQKSKCCQEIVSFLYNRLIEKISNYDSNLLLKALCYDLEKVVLRNMIAQKRYAYDTTCFYEKADRIIEDYNEINATSISLRFLVEITAAIQPSGKEPLGELDYEYLLSLCRAIVMYAHDNDMFHYHMFDKELKILRSGRLAFKDKIDDELIEVNVLAAKNRLNMLSNPDVLSFSNSELSTLPKDEIDGAFVDEYGYSFSQFADCVFSIIDYGKTIDNDVKVASIDDVIRYVSSITGIQNELIKKIINEISLYKRDDFLKPEKPFCKEDVYPWRFNRRLSFTRRPIIIIEDEMIWGNRQLFHMWCFTIDLIEKGKLKADKSKLKKLMGSIVNKRGNVFNHEVFSVINCFNGYIVNEKVSKINKCKVQKEDGNDAGDIDILAIDTKKKRIIVCEVKDFSFCKSPYEMYLQYQDLFCDKGKKLCYISKHKIRVEWVKNHIDEIIKVYQLKPGKWKVIDTLIVSNDLTCNLLFHKDQNIVTFSSLNKKVFDKLK